ncbi:MAG: PAS domain-containing protein, partial [Moraxellaceae bacterium]
LLTGLIAAAILKAGFEESMSSAFLLTTRSNAAAFSNTIAQHSAVDNTISAQPALASYLRRLTANPDDIEARQFAEEIGRNFLLSGVSGIRFYTLNNQPMLSVGTPLQETPTLQIPLNMPNGKTSLLWNEGFWLHTEILIPESGEDIAKVIVERPLNELSAMMKSYHDQSKSTDLLICGRRNDEAVCFPSRFQSEGLRIPLFKDGKPYVPMSRALLGESGVTKARDFRGIQVVAGFSPIDSLGLGLVVKADVIDAFAPIRYRLNLFAAVVILLVALGTLILRGRVQPLARQLVKEQQRTQVILETSHEAFIGIDASGRVTDWNIMAEQTFGWAYEEAFNRDLAELII